MTDGAEIESGRDSGADTAARDGLDGPSTPRCPSFALASAVVALVAAMAVFGALTLLVGFNPATVRAQVATDPNELLEDASFDLPPALSAWQPVPGSPAEAYRKVTGDGAIDGSGHGIVRGTIRQDVPLPPVDGRAYRAVVAVRGAGGSGVLRVGTACAAGEERAETHFTPTAEWHDVSATLTSMRGAACSLRVELASLDGSPIAVDHGSFADAGLNNPSFEQGGTGWVATSGAVFTTAADRGAFDGGALARLRSTSAGGSLVQDVELDRSSEPILATVRVEVRSIGPTATVELQLRQPCSDHVVSMSASVGKAWTPIVVSMRRTPAARPGGVAPDPPQLIRPTGDPCNVGVAVVLRTPGTIEIDGASLELRSYNPASGSPAYKARLGTMKHTGLDDDVADTTVAGGSTPDARDRDAARRSRG